MPIFIISFSNSQLVDLRPEGSPLGGQGGITPLFFYLLEPDVRRRVEIGAAAAPVVDQVLGEGQSGFLEKARPADALDPVGQALPRPRVLLVDLQDLLHYGSHLDQIGRASCR